MKLSSGNIILVPFSIVYGWVMAIRNFFFDTGILPSKQFGISTICVGNLAAGGTGKTPHVEYLLSLFKKDFRTAVLSRGYMRKTSGFILAAENTNSRLIGDEPFQIFSKFPDVQVAVDEKRVNGINKLLKLIPGLNLIILDDAYQHRFVQPGLSILLTDYSNLYINDLILPAGTLRESRKGSKRADIIMVTKCPEKISPIEMRLIEEQLKPESHQSVFFSTYEYSDIEPVFGSDETSALNLEKIKAENVEILLVTGIAKPDLIAGFLKNFSQHIESLFFADHHNFSTKDIKTVKTRFEQMKSGNGIVIVTEKDAARITSQPDEWQAIKHKLYKLPVKVKLLNNKENIFKTKIYNYVTENSRNS